MWRALQKACAERFSDGGGRGGIAEFFGAGSGGRMRGCVYRLGNRAKGGKSERMFANARSDLRKRGHAPTGYFRCGGLPKSWKAAPLLRGGSAVVGLSVVRRKGVFGDFRAFTAPRRRGAAFANLPRKTVFAFYVFEHNMGKERAEIASEFPVRAFVEYFVNVRRYGYGTSDVFVRLSHLTPYLRIKILNAILK